MFGEVYKKKIFIKIAHMEICYHFVENNLKLSL